MMQGKGGHLLAFLLKTGALPDYGIAFPTTVNARNFRSSGDRPLGPWKHTGPIGKLGRKEGSAMLFLAPFFAH